MINLELNTKSEKLFKMLLRKHNNDENSLINSIVKLHKDQLKKGIKNIRVDLAYFENKYEMTTKDFYNDFVQGVYADENNDFMQWSGEYEILLDYLKELKEFEK
jgi:hypothetical protein